MHCVEFAWKRYERNGVLDADFMLVLVCAEEADLSLVKATDRSDPDVFQTFVILRRYIAGLIPWGLVGISKLN